MVILRMLIGACLVLSGSVVSAQSIAGVQGRTTAEREVRAAEDQMHKAYVAGDKEAFRNMYTDDSTFTYNSGLTVDRETRVKGLYAFKDLNDEILSITMAGSDVALVRCISKYSNATQPGTTHLTILRVWHKRNGKWQVLAFQSTVVRQASGAR